ncbi:hypothetical protein [Arabidopsis thaliana]|uniref:Uncharacterized protein K10A8_90 n=1 Tax=Arabidopsis thaliana TaxID=3702 RepID=Q9LF63_ARATH|nr:hypothetical protein [Arabidopsis thaliana]
MEISQARSSFVCLLLLLLSMCFVPCVFSKSPRPISDVEIRQKKSECYGDIESGLWGWQCKSSAIAKENCALRCLSPVCYQLIYESDPQLEEGEKDLIRSQEYKYCMYKAGDVQSSLSRYESSIYLSILFRSSLGESLEGVRGIF